MTDKKESNTTDGKTFWQTLEHPGKMADGEELTLIIEPYETGILKETDPDRDRKYIGFKVEVKGLHQDIDHLWINCFIPILRGDERGFQVHTTPVLLHTKDLNIKNPDAYQEINALSHRLATTIYTHDFKHKEYETLMGYAPNKKELDQRAYSYFGNLLKKILESVGYIITIETPDYYFPSPTATGLVVPAFGYGLLKKAKPFDVRNGYETTITYLSIEKPQSKVQVQLKLMDRIEDRIYEYQKLLKDVLTPYGLKCLYLAIAECARNHRQNWFVLDTNYCLDRFGYKRNRKGVHQPRSRKRLLKEFESLTKIKFNIERRQPKKGSKDKVRAFRITGPIVSISDYKLEEWEVEANKPIEEGTHIADKVPIFVHPNIYDDIEDWYTLIPANYLTIDTGRRPHAIQLYPYIANQWRVGWTQHRGIIKQSVRRILEGSGLIHSYYSIRTNRRVGFIKNIKDNIVWLKNQNQYWIESVRFKVERGDPLDQIITIKMAENHPLMIGMNNTDKTTA